MATEKLIRMTKRLFSDLERMCDSLQKLLYTSAPAGPFPEPADPTMRSIFAIEEFWEFLNECICCLYLNTACPLQIPVRLVPTDARRVTRDILRRATCGARQ